MYNIRRSLFIVSLILTIFLTTAIGQNKSLIPENWNWEPLFTIPNLSCQVAIDGNLEKNEWEYATEVGNFIDEKTSMQAIQSGKFLLGYREQDLHLGFVCERPKGSGTPKIQFNEPGWSSTPLWIKDDNLEVWLAPFVEGVTMSGMMSPRYALAANAAGAYSHDMTGWDRTEIPRELEYVSNVKGELWQGEMRFPWNMVSKMSVTQNKRPPSEGVQWKGSFFFQQRTPFHALIGTQHTLEAFPTLVFSEKPIGFEVSSVELVGDRQARFSAGVRNGSKETVDYELHYDIFMRKTPPKSSDEQFVKYWKWLKRIKEVGPEQAAAERGGVLDIKSYEAVIAELNNQYDYVDGGIRTISAAAGEIVKEEVLFSAVDGYYLFGYSLVDSKTKETKMRQVIPVLLSRMLIQMRPEFLKAEKLIVRVETGAVRGSATGDILEVSIFDVSGNLLEKSTQIVDLAKQPTEIILSTQKTKENTQYKIKTSLNSTTDGVVLAEVEENILRPKNPEWINSGLGLTDKVPPGFEPIRELDNGFELALRKIIFDNNIFPQQIKTRNEDFLADPIELTALIDGKKVNFSREKLVITEMKPTSAKFQQLWIGEGLNLLITAQLDYDGFIRYDLQLANQKRPINLNELTLIIPVKSEYAQWYSHRELGTKLSGNPGISGFPYGDLKDFYKAYPDGLMPFSWQLFLGTRDRGIEWVAESDRDWSPKNEMKMMGLQKKNDRVNMVFRFVDAECQLSEDRNIAFGITITPVRDFPRELYYSRARGLGQSLYPNTPLNPETKPEIEKIYKNLADLGIKVAHHYTNFGPELFSNIRFYDEEQLNKVRGVNKLARKYGLINVFYCGFALPPGIPHNEVFGNEMRMEPEFRGWYNHASPYMDYFLHSAKFMHENTFVDAFHTDGLNIPWLMSNPTYNYSWTRNGEKHGTYPIFAVRELFKRFYTMLKFELPDGLEGYHMPHVNDAPVYCIEGFSDMDVTGEQHYTTISKLEDLSLTRYSIVYNSLEQGVPRMGIWHHTNDIPVTKNTMLTMHNLHGTLLRYDNVTHNNTAYEAMGGYRSEIQMWQSFDRRTADFLPYWQYPNLLEVTSDIKGVDLPKDAIKASAYVHKDKGRAIIILANLDLVGYSLRCRINLKELGFEGKIEDYRIVDPILNNYYYPVVGDEIRLDIYPQRWRAIQINKK